MATLWVLNGCAALGFPLHGSAIEGRVLEQGTEQPIPDAIVVARWIGYVSSYADSSTVCYHVLSTTTDAEGVYRFPAWRKENTEGWHKNLTHREVKLDAYSDGYKTVAAKDHSILYLRRDTGSVQERLDRLISFSVSCGGEEDKKLLSLYLGLYKEASKIASTREEVLKALILLKDVEKQEVGSTESWRRFEQRKRELR